MPRGGHNKGQRSFPLTEEQIRRVYLEQDVSMKEAAMLLGCSVKVLWRACQDYGLPAKSKTRAIEKGRPLQHTKLGDHAWLQTQMATRTFHDIAQDLGTAPTVVSGYARRHGLYTGYATQGEAVRAGASKMVKPIPKAQQIPKEVIIREYLEKDINIYAACKVLGCSPPTLIAAMAFYELKPKDKLRKLIPMGMQPGDTWLSQNGYVMIYIPGYPGAKAGMVLEHRVVAEETLGRPLAKHEVVHHDNRKRNDNRPENLLVVTRAEHRMIHQVEDTRQARAVGLPAMCDARWEAWYDLLREQHAARHDLASPDMRAARDVLLQETVPVSSLHA